jgi:hypothetical protein
MADTYKSLGQAVGTGGDVDVYTVPASTAAIVSAVVVSNVSTEDLVTFRVRVAGAAKADKQVICYEERVPGQGQFTFVGGLAMGAGDVLTMSTAGSGCAVNVYGVEQSPVPAMAPKILGQSAPSAATSTTIYTVPSGKSAIINGLSICNLNTAQTAVRLSHSVGGGAIANKDYLIRDLLMPGSPSGDIAPGGANLLQVLGITAAATDVFRVYSNLASCAFNLWGVEL